MKIKKLALFGLLSFLSVMLGSNAGAQLNIETNIYPICYLSGDNTQEAIYYKTRLEHGELVPEILPAEQDADGNWGGVTEKWQLSARFRHSKFSTNEPVMAVIILRNFNLTSRTMVLSVYSYKYTLIQGTNTSVYEMKAPNRDQQREDPGESWNTINGKSEGLMVVRLNDYFDLSHPGEYVFQAQIRAPKIGGNGYVNVTSGRASFLIVQQP